MLNVLLLNKFEIVLFIIAIIMLIEFYKKAGYSRKEIILWMLVLIPILYFSINMVSEAVTTDEPQYEECITDIQNLKNYPAAEKVLYEYKFTQLTIGTVFWLIPKSMQNVVQANNVWKIYKCLHWLLMYIMSLLTAIVWQRLILMPNNDVKKRRLGENAVLITLIGLPLTCLLMKVTNYDAGSTYPAILGISLMWGAYKHQNKKMAFLATIVTALGVLDKWTALPYWIIAVVLFSYLSVAEEDNTGIAIRRIMIDTFVAYAGALLMSTLYFIYAVIQQRGFCRDVDLGVIIFSFVHAIKGITTGDLSVNSSPKDAIYIPILYLIMVAIVFVLFKLCNVIRKLKKEPANVFLEIDAFLIAISIIGGVIGAYFIPLRIAPFLPIDEGFYKSVDSFDGWTYHFGARTGIGHFIAKVCYEWATILANFPTVIMILLFAVAVWLFKKNYDKRFLFCSLMLSASLALLLFYAIEGLPSDARYFSYPMLILVLSTIYILHEEGFYITRKKIFLNIAYSLYLIEMITFIPNVKSFSPIWLWHSMEHNETVRTGEWYAGEVMFWGDHLAVAGNIIQEIEGKENAEGVIVYSDYTTTWPGNPGYVITTLNNKNSDGLRFDEDSYYVINKFWIFRGNTPSYIRDVEPIARISYKGEIGAWIYRGDQLTGYKEELVN